MDAGHWSASHERWYKWLCGFRALDLHCNSGITWTEIEILKRAGPVLVIDHREMPSENWRAEIGRHDGTNMTEPGDEK
jgi:hypothetical protein